MRILVFSWRDPKHPFAGGAEQVMHQHMKGWVAAGHEVTLFTSHFKGGSRNENMDGVEIIRRGYQLLGTHVAAVCWYILGQHPKFDLIVDEFHGIPFFTPLYVHAKKLAILQEVAREVWFLNHLPKPFNWIIGLIGYLVEPSIFLLYRDVPFMVGSNSAKKDLVDFGVPARNITVVPHGVVLGKGKKFPKEKTNTVMFLGALTKDKGVEDVIRTFSILNEVGEFNFWIVGRGGERYFSELKRLTKKLRIAKKIKFWGFVSNKKKFELLGRAHILINPSIREGWGLVNIEANSVGTPVVAYKSPGLVDSIKDGVSGILCKENTPESLADEVFRLVNDDVRLEKLSESATAWSKNFSWDLSRKLSLTLIRDTVRVKKV